MTKRRSSMFQLLALLLAVLVGALVTLLLLERPPRFMEGASEPGVSQQDRGAERERVTPSPGDGVADERVPPGDPFGFDWAPFGPDWDELFIDPWDRGGAGGRDPDNPLQREMERMREEMRAELDEMRRAFRGRMAPPLAAPPPVDDGGDHEPEVERRPPDAGVRFDVSRVSLPDAVLLLVRVKDLKPGSFDIALGDGQVVVSAERIEPDGVGRRYSRSLALEEEIDPDGVEVTPLGDGYRVLLPYR